jgi:hypothetical protein
MIEKFKKNVNQNDILEINGIQSNNKGIEYKSLIKYHKQD